jgi:lysophospholipase L1-like esterase
MIDRLKSFTPATLVHATRSALAFSLVALLLSTSGAAETLRILPLGDSITQGRGGSNPVQSYRYELWKRLIDANVDFDFVGEMQHGFDEQIHGDPVYPDYQGNVFDKDHQGHWGWTTKEILEGTSQSWRRKEGRLPLWLEAYTPDIALILLGTNDGRSASFDLAETRANMSAIIDQLRADNPEIIIFLGLLFQGYEPLPLINQAYRELAEEKTTETSPIHVVDHSVGWINDPSEPNADTIDNDHPSPSGDQKLANNWFEAMRPYILETYASWSRRQFVAPEETDAMRTADPDGDFYSNLVEYALGMNPLAPDSHNGFRLSAENGSIAYQFTPASAPTDLRLVVEGSADAETWDEVLYDSDTDQLATSEATISTPLTDLSFPLFLRLRVEEKAE